MQFNNLPFFNELPDFAELPGCAWDVWGKGDQLGTVNLLTEEVVQRAASEEIKTGKSIRLEWPINFTPMPKFLHRIAPDHKIIEAPGYAGVPIRDDELHINTQSGSQWDGLRHFGILSQGVFYQGIPQAEIKAQTTDVDDPVKFHPDRVKLGIHNWAQHGICGRGVLVDLIRFYTESGKKDLSYDPWSSYAIPVKDIQAAAAKQGVKFRQGDILLLRIGFIQKYNSSSKDEKDALIQQPDAFAGIEQSLEMKQFLWDNHFAAIASDQPALERYPAPAGQQLLHDTIIGLWGMPLGEFFNLEDLAKFAHETGRYTFFFSSWPLNVVGGVASPPNAAAIF